MKLETFNEARARLMRELASRGWTVTTHKHCKALKRPYATKGSHRVTFRAQALYDETDHSITSDIRGVSWDSVEAWIDDPGSGPWGSGATYI